MIDVFEAGSYVFQVLRYVNELYCESLALVALQRVSCFGEKPHMEDNYSVVI